VNKNIFDVLNEFIREAETSLVNLLSAIGPWLAPLAPAAMSYTHMIASLKFPVWIAMSVAVVVETLGLSAVSTIIAFWSYNRRRVAQYKKAPVALALSAGIFYLVTVLSINVAMDATRLFELNPAWAEILSRALLTLLTIPAALILAIRTQHKELLDQADKDRRDGQQHSSGVKTKTDHVKSNNGNGSSGTNGNGSGREAGRKGQFIKDLRSGALRLAFEAANATTPQACVYVISEKYGVSERTAWRWWDEIKQATNVLKGEQG